jgi:hypothetical protein
MTLTSEQLALVTTFVEESYDHALAIILHAFLIKNGSIDIADCAVGDNNVSFATDVNGTDPTKTDPYDDTDYVVNILKAEDIDEIDCKGELTITDITVNGFIINTLRPCEIEWQTARRGPKIDFNTNS